MSRNRFWRILLPSLKHRHRFQAVGFYATDDPDEVIILFRCTWCAYEHAKSVARLYGARLEVAQKPSAQISLPD